MSAWLGSVTPLPTDHAFRRWLARRIEIEAWAAARSYPGNRAQCFGRVLGFLEVGVHLGYWSKKTADGVAESVRQGYGIGRVRRRCSTEACLSARLGRSASGA